MTDAEASIGFSIFPGIGPVRYRLLVDYFGSAIASWNASLGKLKETGLGDMLAEKFDRFRKETSIPSYISSLRDAHITPIIIGDSHYPKQLAAISDPPIVLYVKGHRGKELVNWDRAIGVVGTRKMTEYGRQMTEYIVRDLVSAGCPIISGMAYGIDAVAHETAISMHGATVAVLGCGVDIIAPSSNYRIYHTLSDTPGAGAVLSEMPLGLRPGKGLFPARNRIISGLSRGVVVIEGAEDSGALITARYAAEQGRDVFAVPGDVRSPTSRGVNALLKNGATLIESGADILAAYSIPVRPSRATISVPESLSPVGKAIFTHIEAHGPTSVDELIRVLGYPSSDILSEISLLEISGSVRDHGEKVYGIVT